MNTVNENKSTNKSNRCTPYELVLVHTSSKALETLYNQKELLLIYVRDLNNKIYHYSIAREKTDLQ